jgi:hypothetical protein
MGLEIGENSRRPLPKIALGKRNGKEVFGDYETTVRASMDPEDAEELIDSLTRYTLKYLSARRIGMDVTDSFQNPVAAERLARASEWAENPKAVLILDDLGREKETPAIAGRLASILAARYERRAPTLITSNLGPDAIGDRYGADIRSRLLDRRWMMIVPIRGEDARLCAPRNVENLIAL